MKFIFITGGVTSSLGKGVLSATLGALLQAKGYKVRIKKMDPYLNVDPGTMNPKEHGEVFVTEDGAETDLDLGHYERFTGNFTNKHDSISAGKIYFNVIEKERKGDYLGATIQVIPHVTNEIKNFITADLTNEDFVICETGGTVGDIEATPFIEAIRQFIQQQNKPNKSKNAISIHLTLIPYLDVVGESKTKPTQHSVKELQSLGIKPDILVCRASHPVDDHDKNKIALFCNVDPQDVIMAYDTDSLYKIPLQYNAEKIDTRVENAFGIATKPSNLTPWLNLEEKLKTITNTVTIAFVGKYLVLKDSYKSIIEALSHAGLHNNIKVNLKWVNAEELEDESADLSKIFANIGGILVGPGFGNRGVEGKINAINYARTNNIPFFGICLGMQMAIIEFARNKANLTNANSTEFNPNTKHPVVSLITEWQQNNTTVTRTESSNKGGTMRLGAYDCVIKPNTLASKIYNNQAIVQERHRHRYEVDISYKQPLENSGLVFSGMSPDNQLTEIIEFPKNDFFVGVQFHPELKSQIFAPRPLFISFVQASFNHSNKK